MNRRVEKMIPKAIEAVNEFLASNNEVKSEYNGYISSFGASIIQTGLKAAIAFNENTNSGSNEDKQALMQAILKLVKSNMGDNEKLLPYVISEEEQGRSPQNEIMDAAIALKLAIRTFKLEKK